MGEIFLPNSNETFPYFSHSFLFLKGACVLVLWVERNENYITDYGFQVEYLNS